MNDNGPGALEQHAYLDLRQGRWCREYFAVRSMERNMTQM